MTDFIFMVQGTSHMFITGPDVVKTVTGEDVTLEELGGAMSHATKSGVATFVSPDEKACLDDVRHLLSFLPSNNLEEPPLELTGDEPDRQVPELIDFLPTSPNQPYDMKRVIAAVVDDGEYLEVHRHWAMSITCGFARMDGRVVGIVGNQPAVLAGVLDIDSSEKASRFVRTCDAFNIPLLTFVDVPGFMPGTDQEYGGIIRHGAKLLYAYCEATVPRIQIITRKAYGGAYVVMNSKSIGADLAFAWPSAELAVMGPNGAVEIVYRRELAEAADPAGAAGRADRRVHRALRQPVHRGGARLHRRRDLAGRHPRRHLPQPRHPGLQARGAAAAQARQRAAVTPRVRGAVDAGRRPLDRLRCARRASPIPACWPPSRPPSSWPGPARRPPTSTTRCTSRGASAGAGGTSRCRCGATGPGRAADRLRRRLAPAGHHP